MKLKLKHFSSLIVLLIMAALLIVIAGGCGGSSSHRSKSENLTAGATVALNLDSEEGIYNVFLAEYNGWNNVEAAQTPYEGNVSVPAFIHSKKLPNIMSPDVISVNLSAGTEYTVEFSKNLCQSLGALLPDISIYAPDGSEVAFSSFEHTVYPEESPSIICLTFTPSVTGIYKIHIFSADAGDTDNDGYVLRVYKEMRNPEDDNKAGYPVRYTVSNSSGRTAIVTADDIILFRRMLFEGVVEYESVFNLLPVHSTDGAEGDFEEWFKNVQHYYSVYEDEDEDAETEDEADSQTVRTADASDTPLIIYDTTEIESSLSGIPYDNTYELGNGYNALTNFEAAAKNAFENPEDLESLLPKRKGTPSTKYTYKFVSTASEMEKEMGTQAGLSLAGNALGLSHSSSTNYKFGITSTTLLIRYSELEPRYRTLPTSKLVLTEEAKNALDEGSNVFRTEFGDYYVSGYQYGGSYLMSLTITTRTTKQLNNMTTKIGANLKDDDGASIVSGDFAKTMKEMTEENNATLTFQSVTHGMSKTPIVSDVVSGDKAIDELVKGLQQFKGDIASKFSAGTYEPVFVRLSRFRNLPGKRSKIDINIPVSSDHAVNIMKFNRAVMNMRGYYNVINEKETDAIIDQSVVQGYETRFNNVIDNVKVAKNQFYTDRTRIPVLMPQVKTLCTEMKALGDRYTFYRMLIQAQEDQARFTSDTMQKVGKGIEFGYSSFGSSKAVTEDINAGSTKGEMKEESQVETNGAKNPIPGYRWLGSFDAGANNIFCYLHFTTDNKDGDKYREVESPCVGRRNVRYDCWSGNSRSYGFRFRLMPMRFNRTDYPISGLK